MKMAIHHLDGVKRRPDPLITCPKCGPVSRETISPISEDAK
jgi:hypothetical protein